MLSSCCLFCMHFQENQMYLFLLHHPPAVPPRGWRPRFSSVCKFIKAQQQGFQQHISLMNAKTLFLFVTQYSINFHNKILLFERVIALIASHVTQKTKNKNNKKKKLSGLWPAVFAVQRADRNKMDGRGAEVFIQSSPSQ